MQYTSTMAAVRSASRRTRCAVLSFAGVAVVALLLVWSRGTDLHMRESSRDKLPVHKRAGARLLSTSVRVSGQQKNTSPRDTATDRTTPVDFEGFDNVTGALGGAILVPNIVHYVRFDQAEFSFMEFICILSALRRQRPEAILFHSNLQNFTGHYWGQLLRTPGFSDVAKIVETARPIDIFGQKFDADFGRFHSTDVARVQILMQYGGIFCDGDVYVSQSLDPLRVFEMTLAWPPGAYLGNQILLAHRDARFLREWLETYRGAYEAKRWYYNAGERPTELLLQRRPELIHRETSRLWVDWDRMCHLYARRWATWKADTMAVHLHLRHSGKCAKSGRRLGLRYPVVFTEENILRYNVTILDMVLDVYPELLEQRQKAVTSRIT